MREMRALLERSLSDEILYGRPEQLRVFVSSQMREQVLAIERQVAVEAIESEPSYCAWAWEREAVAGPYCSEKVCVANASTSDALVLPVAATSHRLPRRSTGRQSGQVFLASVLLKAGAQRTALAARFVSRERRNGVVTADFGNVAELRTQVVSALRHYHVMVHRRSILAAKKARP